MVNKDRIVLVTKMDFLSLIGTVMTMTQFSYSVLEATDIEGDFSVIGSGGVGTLLANQPLKSLDFSTGVTGGAVFFVPAYDYAGVTVAGAAVTPAEGSDEVVADGISLYKAVLSSGAVTITALTPAV